MLAFHSRIESACEVLTIEVSRAAFFQQFVQENGDKPLGLEAIQAKINE